MRAISWSWFALVFLIGGVAGAGPSGSRDCAKPAIQKARRDADKAVAARDYARAIALLEPLVKDCRAGVPSDRAWLASDLAVAYEKAGQLVECQRLMAPLSHPSSGLRDAGGDKLARAIEHNLDRCSKALDAKYVAIKRGGCALTVDHAIAAAAAPPAMVPRGASAACVALVPGVPAPRGPDDDPEVRDVVCPVVALFWKGARPTLERQALSPGGSGPLGDDSVCCNLSAIAAGAIDGKTLVRVRGQGRDCSGGTADTASDMFYEWSGTALRPSLDASVGFH